MPKNPLLQVQALGQSIWLDLLRRSLITDGSLQKLVDEDGLRGVTSNPKIFDKAIEGSSNYDEDIQSLADKGKSTNEIYESLAISDIRGAADVLRPTYDRLDGRDGFVSLEVNPHLAHDTDGTIAEARRLWKAVDRPNVFIKIPATKEGLPAIRQCLGEGINVNITLLFGLPRYREVVKAYLGALEDRAARSESNERIASVASFFLSRIDVLVDPKLQEMIDAGGDQAEAAKDIKGQTAIASARLAYQIYKEMFQSERFAKLKEQGARTQRVLWASTSTKDPDYSDVRYVEALIGPETVNTVPMETLDAYRDHGNPALRVEEDLDLAQRVMDTLPKLGIDIDKVTQQLEGEGVEKFNEPFDSLLESLKKKRAQLAA